MKNDVQLFTNLHFVRQLFRERVSNFNFSSILIFYVLAERFWEPRMDDAIFSRVCLAQNELQPGQIS